MGFMGRPPVGIRPMTGTERNRRYRERLRVGSLPKPPPTDAELLALARREIWHLRRRIGQLEREASSRGGGEYYLTAPLYEEIRELKRENDRLRALLDRHVIASEGKSP